MVVGTTIVGLQAIGLIMVIALLVTPAASTDFGLTISIACCGSVEC